MKNVKKSHRFSRILKWIGWVLLAQIILLNVSAALHAYKLTHFYSNAGSANAKTTSRNIFSKTWKLFVGPRIVKSLIRELPQFEFETIRLKTRNNLNIEAWYCPVDSAKGTVILFHGISSNKSFLIPEASEFRKSGFNVMLVDLRAHGNSGGSNCTIGFLESEEVSLAYDYATKRLSKKIFLYGVSMGAVIITKAISEYGLKPEGVILEMPFASLYDHMKARVRTLGFPEQPFGVLVTFWTGLERGFNGFNHKTSFYSEKVYCPVLMQWGAKDNFALKSETNEIFAHLASSNKKLVIYKNAGHESLFYNEPEKWKNEIREFLE